jgi:hypothetical protein
MAEVSNGKLGAFHGASVRNNRLKPETTQAGIGLRYREA